MSITFALLQQRFEQAWLESKLLPASVTIAEADYEAFESDLFPKKEWTAFERDLLGEERLAELDLPHASIDYIINYMNCQMVKLVRDPEQPPGTIILSEA